MLSSIVLKGGYAHFNMHIFTFNWLTLTSDAFCQVSPWGSFLFTLQRQNKVCTPGDEAIMKIHKKIRNYFLVYHLTSHFLLYLQNYKEFEVEILDLQLEKYGLSLDIKKYTTPGWALGDENVIGIRSFKSKCCQNYCKCYPPLFGGVASSSSKMREGKVIHCVECTL